MVYDEAVVAERRNRDLQRLQYEAEILVDPLNHDIWFAYIGLEVAAGANKNRIRELFRRAIAIVPPVPAFYMDRKLRWRLYIDLWIYYATYEEGHGGNAAQVYEQCLAVIPHHNFSYAKVWLHAAGLELRKRNLKGARKILNTAIRVAPKRKLFRGYIEMEMKICKVTRCRKLFEKYLCWMPSNSDGWIKYAELERRLTELERVRAIFELGIDQSRLDAPELLWKAYIDFEISEGETEKARQLYERLLDRTSKHVQVWNSYARFEALENHSIENARMVFRRAADHFTWAGTNENEKDCLRQEWLVIEASFGDLGDVSLVQSNLPKKLRIAKR